MEGHEGLTESSDTNKYKPWFADFADSLCTYYMSMGVTYDEYWYGDCSRFHFYEEVYQLKQKEKNFDSWLMGRYVYEAIADLSPILHAFAKPGTKATPYPADPFPLTEEDARDKEERERRRKYEQIKVKTTAWAAEVNAHFAKGGENNG